MMDFLIGVVLTGVYFSIGYFVSGRIYDCDDDRYIWGMIFWPLIICMFMSVWLINVPIAWIIRKIKELSEEE